MANVNDLSEMFAGSTMTGDVNSTAAPHPRFSSYKMKTPGSADQEVRRKRILQQQKSKRFDYHSHVRRLKDDFWEDLSDEEEEGEQGQGQQDMDDSQEEQKGKERDSPSDIQFVNRYFRRPGRHYRNQLMLSEWMLEIPENFEEDWITIPVPKGKRNLVVASNGTTATFSKTGYPIKSFPSLLPGGARAGSKWHNESVILDCIYVEKNQTFYVLDLMAWKNIPYYQNETDCRLFLLKNFLDEYPEVTEKSRFNKYRFIMLKNYPCSKESISHVMNNIVDENYLLPEVEDQGMFNAADQFDLDGLMFFHKKNHYTFGVTPLVTWLLAHHLPEILGINIPEKYMAMKPESYTTFQNHAVEVRKRDVEKKIRDQQKEEKRKQKVLDKKQEKLQKQNNESMDSSSNLDYSSSNPNSPYVASHPNSPFSTSSFSNAPPVEMGHWGMPATHRDSSQSDSSTSDFQSSPFQFRVNFPSPSTFSGRASHSSAGSCYNQSPQTPASSFMTNNSPQPNAFSSSAFNSGSQPSTFDSPQIPKPTRALSSSSLTEPYDQAPGFQESINGNNAPVTFTPPTPRPVFMSNASPQRPVTPPNNYVPPPRTFSLTPGRRPSKN